MFKIGECFVDSSKEQYITVISLEYNGKWCKLSLCSDNYETAKAKLDSALMMLFFLEGVINSNRKVLNGG